MRETAGPERSGRAPAERAAGAQEAQMEPLGTSGAEEALNQGRERGWCGGRSESLLDKLCKSQPPITSVLSAVKWE